MFKVDREKYLKIMESEGVEAALTQLHHDKEAYEYETFEGREGYQREKWDDLADFRDFSRELWNTALERPSVQKKQDLPR